MEEIQNFHEEADNGLNLSPLFLWAGLAATGILLSQFAFSKKSRQAILERDGYQCVETGRTDNLHASHIDHNRDNPDYDNPNNGRTLNIIAHLRDHILRVGQNGLTQEQNDWAINKLEERIDDIYG